VHAALVRRFAIGLNDPADPIVAHLPPTDSRFRQDQVRVDVCVRVWMVRVYGCGCECGCMDGG
jgi:hypothetical protein